MSLAQLHGTCGREDGKAYHQTGPGCYITNAVVIGTVGGLKFAAKVFIQRLADVS